MTNSFEVAGWFLAVTILFGEWFLDVTNLFYVGQARLCT